MKNILEVAAAIIVALGGSGAIILALANWLGKVWANRLLEKEKFHLTKELQIDSDLRKMKIQYYHDFLKVFTIQCNYVNTEPQNALTIEHSREFAVECNRLVLYASKDVIEFVEKAKAHPKDSNPTDLINLIRQDIYNANDNVVFTFIA